MGAAGGRQAVTLVDQLEAEPWRFEFHQAVRLIELWAMHRGSDAFGPPAPVGRDFPLQQETVRFHSWQARRFPASQVVAVQAADRPGEPLKVQMQVAFMGLTGPAGVLPESYLDLILQRVRDRDFSLRDFFDLFNHRTISLFYRAWEKYRFHIGYERAQLRAEGNDLVSECLDCLVGMGTDRLKPRQAIGMETLRHYVGHFARFPRAAVVLEAIVRDYFKVPVRLRQFVGRWLALADDECTRMPTRAEPQGRFNQLGVDALIGARVWDVQSLFVLRLGPLSWRRFMGFLPGSDGMRQLTALTRLYVGPELDFQVELVLLGKEVPPLRLGAGSGDGPLLGWNTWFGPQASAVDRDDVRLTTKGWSRDAH